MCCRHPEVRACSRLAACEPRRMAAAHHYLIRCGARPGRRPLISGLPEIRIKCAQGDGESESPGAIISWSTLSENALELDSVRKIAPDAPCQVAAPRWAILHTLRRVPCSSEPDPQETSVGSEPRFSRSHARPRMIASCEDHLARLYTVSARAPLPPGLAVVSLSSSPDKFTVTLSSVPSLLGLRAPS
jgi:hypothetical protein